MTTDGRTWLLRTLKIVAAKDSGAFRQAVFADLAKHNRAVQAALFVHRMLGRGVLSSLFVSSYGLKSFLAVKIPAGAAPIWSAAAYRNERRQFAWLDTLLKPGSRADVDISTRALASVDALRALAAAVTHPDDLRRSFRIIQRIDQDGDFLVSCRVASALGYFVRFSMELEQRQPKAVLVSTDSNPYGLGLAFAAKQRGLPAFYIPHGHIPDGPPRLHFDLSLLDGEALRQLYEESGPIAGDVAFKGCEGERRPMQAERLRRRPPSVGIFLSLVTDWPRLGRLIADLQRTLQPRQLLIRLHPNELVRPPDAVTHFGRWDNLVISYGEQVLLADAEQCDFVLAGNSSCHLTLLKYGIPTVYVEGMDDVPRDFYRFLRHRIVPEYDRVDQIDLDGLAAFYEDPDWMRRFGFFDASYLDGSCDDAVRRAIAAFVPEAAP